MPANQRGRSFREGQRIKLRGLSAAVIGTRFILYIPVDTAAEANQAMATLQEA